jgi:hypothetical protein
MVQNGNVYGDTEGTSELLRFDQIIATVPHRLLEIAIEGTQ